MGELGLNNAIHRLYQIYVFTYNNRTLVHIISSIQSERTKRAEQKGKTHLIYRCDYLNHSQFNRFYHNLDFFSKI